MSSDKAHLILIVDDDAVQRTLIREGLEQAGYSCEVAVNGIEGLDKSLELQPDLVLLDVEMPCLDGISVCCEIRNNPRIKHVPVIMITGHGDTQTVEQAFEVGATNFLMKPIDFSLLPANVKHVLQSLEIRLTGQLLGHWWDLRGDSEFPSVNDLETDAIKHIWAECFLVQAAKRIDESTFQHIGETIAARSGLLSHDLTLSQIPEGTLLSTALRNLEELFESRAPVINGGEFETARGKRFLFRSILLPLSGDQRCISYVLGGARCRAVVQDS